MVNAPRIRLGELKVAIGNLPRRHFGRNIAEGNGERVRLVGYEERPGFDAYLKDVPLVNLATD